MTITPAQPADQAEPLTTSGAPLDTPFGTATAPLADGPDATLDTHPRESASAFLHRVCAFDESRPSFVGEHAITFGTGVSLLMLAFGRGHLLRMVAAAAGAALIVRSFSGRDGIASLRD